MSELNILPREGKKLEGSHLNLDLRVYVGADAKRAGELIAQLDAMGFVGEYWLADARFSAYDNLIASGLSEAEAKAFLEQKKKIDAMLAKGNAINKAKVVKEQTVVNF